MRLPIVLLTRQQREHRQRVRYREVLSTVNIATRQVEKVRGRFSGLLQQAIAARDDTSVARYARICASLDKRVERFKSLSLTLEGLDAVREMLRVDREFISVAQDLSRYVVGELSHVDTAQFQVSFEQALAHADEFDAQLSEAVEAVGSLALGWGAAATDDEMERKAREEIERHAKIQERDSGFQALIAEEIRSAREALEPQAGGAAK